MRLVEYPPEPESAEEEAKELKAIAAAAEGTGYGGLVSSAAGVELHCHNVRALGFAGSSLYSASDDEVAQWELPLA